MTFFDFVENAFIIVADKPLLKQLFIIRHGKAAVNGGLDFDRPLLPRGISDAEQLACLLEGELEQHDPRLISDAVRARETAQIIFQRLGWPGSQGLKSAYLAPARFWLEQITRWPEPHARGILIGHNPGLSELIHLFTGESIWLPTCGMARVSLGIDAWEEASRGLGSLVSIWTPKG